MRILFVFLFSINSIFAQVNIDKQINNILSKLPSSTTTAVMILDPQNDEVIFEKNRYTSMVPASNTKLYTTATAINLMGPDFQIATKLFTDDLELNDTIMDGSIYLKGFGNSLFTETELDSMVQDVVDLGIRRITGNVVGDDTYFDDIYYRDDWIMDEMPNVELPPISALVLNKNMATILISANKKSGSKVSCEVIPSIDYLLINNSAKVTTKRSSPSLTVITNSNGIDISVSGYVKKSTYEKSYNVYIDNPPLFCAWVLKDKLEKKGIRVLGYPITAETPNKAIELSSSSVSLKEIISIINKKSDNFRAECLFKTIGAYFSGKQGNSFYSTQAVLTFADRNNIFDDGTSIVDGSGISRANEVTVNSIVGLLSSIYKNEGLFEPFYNSLSIAGYDGTLGGRMKYGTNFRGKTGTLRGVSSLSGYLVTQNNKMIIISIIMSYTKKGSDFHRNIQDDIVEYLSETL
ncbi:MAG: D-alanyl-D-alanine carboxypeptidase/D-alanyl-D-alanine-endopeptidase [Ignavibacteriales bacterium]|nr:D-alanyl-D-alanine carboxypeptidase/D-alanyl-D-alanine-endopeptidase [Ignavibacteriales bacterium]